MIIFGVDFGDTRTGWAVCDRSELIASPAGVLTERNFLLCAQKTADAAKEAKAEEIVVGHPLNMNGTLGERALKCEEFAHLLEEIGDIKVVLWDERLTSVDANRILSDAGKKRKKQKMLVDAVAASLILEGYLEFRRKNQG